MAESCTLFWWNGSLCSLFAAYTLDLHNEDAPEGSRISCDKRERNLFKLEQFSEDYLQINPKGQVPALVIFKGELASTLTDSKDICYWIASQSSTLLPQEKTSEIKRLLEELHSLPLSHVAAKDFPYLTDLLIKVSTEMMAAPTSSEIYKKALQAKIDYTYGLKENLRLADPSSYLEGQKDCKSYLERVNDIVKANQQSGNVGWIYGTRNATLLDACIIPFALRLVDIDLHHLVPPELQALAEHHRGKAPLSNLLENGCTWLTPE